MAAELFVATSYSSHVNQATGELSESYRDGLEVSFQGLEENGFAVYNTLRENDYQLPGDDHSIVVEEFSKIRTCYGFISVSEVSESKNKRTNMGYALGIGKIVMLAHTSSFELDQYDTSLVKNKLAYEITTPFDPDQIQSIITP
jgi:hypothetical protein